MSKTTEEVAAVPVPEVVAAVPEFVAAVPVPEVVATVPEFVAAVPVPEVVVAVSEVPPESKLAEENPAAKEVKARAAEAPKEKKPEAPKPYIPEHPPYFQIIKDAILALKEKTWLSPYAIAKHMEEEHKVRSRSAILSTRESMNCPPRSMQEMLRPRSRSVKFDSHERGIMAALSIDAHVKISSPSMEGNVVDPRESTLSRSSRAWKPSSCYASDEVLTNVGLLSVLKDEESEEGSGMPPLVHVSDEDQQFRSTPQELEDDGIDDEIYEKLQHTLTEAENLRREAYEKSCMRQKTKRDAIEASRREAKASETLYLKGLKQSKEMEETLAREKMELESLKIQRDNIFEQLQKAQEQESVLHIRMEYSNCIAEDLEAKLSSANLLLSSLQRGYDELQQERDDAVREVEELRQRKQEQESELHRRIADSYCITKDLEAKLSAANLLLNSLQRGYDELQQERDDAVREVEELRRRTNLLLNSFQRKYDELQQERDDIVRKVEELRQSKDGATSGSSRPMNFSEFSFSELEQATNNFDDSMKIGEGGYGCVYKGFLRHTTVAIKMLNPQSMQGQSEFHQEVDVLSRVRHPHLVMLIGTCIEVCALIYEYCSNGSLEDRLSCMGNTTPLTWKVRTRIAAEICSALIFLHSNKPLSVVHGDLNPANILIDANFVSKLGDFGICRLLVQSNSTTLYRHTHPKGTFVYMDPEFLTSGDLTPASDVYSFGVLLLRLLTGRPALGLIKEVYQARRDGQLHGILDPNAGDWPFVQAKQFAHLALRCCELKRKKRPDLALEAWKVLEPMTKAASPIGSSSLTCGFAPEDSCVPSYYLCPILQEIMMDPHIAADGFTYEYEALIGWLYSGHDTSPMTNLKLAHKELIPNRALRSVIQEWLQQHP